MVYRIKCVHGNAEEVSIIQIVVNIVFTLIVDCHET